MLKNGLNRKLTAKACYIRSACREKSDKDFFKMMFKGDWDYFLIKQNPDTGKVTGNTVRTKTTEFGKINEGKFKSAACC